MSNWTQWMKGNKTENKKMFKIVDSLRLMKNAGLNSTKRYQTTLAKFKKFAGNDAADFIEYYELED